MGTILGTIKSWLSRVRSISTPIGGVSWDGKEPDVHRQALTIGFHLYLLWGLALTEVAKQDSDSEVYQAQSTLLSASGSEANITVDPPPSVVGKSPEEINALFQPLKLSVQAQLEARSESLTHSYWLGRWLAEILLATATAQIASQDQVPQLFDPLLSRYEDSLIGVARIGGSALELRDLRDHIARLSEKAAVTADDYAEVSQVVYTTLRRLGDREGA